MTARGPSGTTSGSRMSPRHADRKRGHRAAEHVAEDRDRAGDALDVRQQADQHGELGLVAEKVDRAVRREAHRVAVEEALLDA